MNVLVLIAVVVLVFTLLSYNYLLAIKASKSVGRKVGSDEVYGDAGRSQEMSVRAVKAYALGDYIVVTTVIQRGGSRRSIGEVVIDEPSLLIPLTQSLPRDEDLNGGSNEASNNVK